MRDKTLSSAGMALLQGFEGLRLAAYQDIAGIWTIGYGHVGPEVRKGQVITQPQAIALLTADLHAAVAVVNRCVRVTINQNQFDALVDFAYNAGIGAFAMSTLLKKINLGDYAGTEAQFLLWDHAGGQVVPGLQKRRTAEAALFAAPVSPAPITPTQKAA